MHTNPSPQRHILMIPYYYPPVDHTGTRRITSFVKYLPQFSYRPVVLTTRTRGSLPEDKATMTFRCDDLTGPFKRAYRAVKLRNVPQDQRANIGLLSSKSRIQRLKMTFLLPDEHILWYPLAVWQGLQIIRTLPIQAIFSTSPPESSHLVALTLKRITGLPWIADFRDGWLFEPLIPQRKTSTLRRMLELPLEQIVMSSADRIITVNDIIAGDMQRRYPLLAMHISTLYNGYDAAALETIQRKNNQKKNRFRVVHTGKFSISRASTKVNELLATLSVLQAQQHPIIDVLEIVLVGTLTTDEMDAIHHSDVKDVFTLVGNVSYQESLQYQGDADVLLLVIAAELLSITGNKIFEYLASGRPILALAPPDSSAGQLVAQHGAGLVVAPDDYTGIERALLTLYVQWLAGLLPTRVPDGVRQFDRQVLTGKLAGLFDELIESIYRFPFRQ
jgi:glycosyltransferase involved in cell wall biosynthesis